MNPVESLAQLTTLGIGGPARVVRAASVDAFADAFVKTSDPVFILGGGSNVLFSDEGFLGTVLMPVCAGITYEARDADTLVVAEAGVTWDVFVAEVVSRGLWGIENLSGIPGTVGGAPVQNIGAYGSELADTLAFVDVVDRYGARKRLDRDTLRFGYRTSLFKEDPGRYAILRVGCRLSRSGAPNLSYRDLAAYPFTSPPSLMDVRDAVCSIRARKFPALHEAGSAGSFFMNPTISFEDAAILKDRYPHLPQFPTNGGVKMSLAWILDHVVGAKGLRVGGAFVWDAQPLVIATDSGATAHDVRVLASLIVARVYDAVGIRITPEVQCVDVRGMRIAIA